MPRRGDRKDPLERALAFVDAGGDCWEWTGALRHSDGYGRFWVSDEQPHVIAHRWLYLALVGEIPPGRELDHLCRNRRCVNPDHLEPVLHRVNVQRGIAGVKDAVKTCCPRGHRYTDENTRRYRGKRFCRTCDRERVRS